MPPLPTSPCGASSAGRWARSRAFSTGWPLPSAPSRERWLTLKAAHTGTAVDAATAAGYAQGIFTKVAYDLHQFMGAMGLTLEHPLHRWTYRAKLLRSEIGGAERNFVELAELVWDAA